MTKTKNKRSFKVAGIMFSFIVLATSVISGTMAKYKSSGNATFPGITPAQWSINVAGAPMTGTIEMDSVEWEIYKEGEGKQAPNHVADNVIAPGTWGYAEITIVNEGEVDATLAVTNWTKPTVASTGLDFKLVAMTAAPEKYADASGDLSNITLNKKGSPTGTSINLYVCYQWQYDVDDGSTDDDDTDLGTNHKEITFGSVTITATQVDPKEA